MQKKIYLSPIGSGLFNVVVVEDLNDTQEELNLEETNLSSELVNPEKCCDHCCCSAETSHEHLEYDAVDEAMEFQLSMSENKKIIDRINELKKKEKELQDLKSLILGKM